MYTHAMIGGIGSGKSEAAQCFERLGAYVVDLDAINRDLLQQEDIIADIIRIIQPYTTPFVTLQSVDGGLQTSVVRDVIFHHAAAKKQLEAYIHPKIQNAAQLHLKQAKTTGLYPYALLAIPLFDVDSPWHAWINKVIWVYAPQNIRRERLLQRGLSAALITQIMQQQVGDDARLHCADYIIDNGGDKMHLANMVRHVHGILSS